MARGRKGMVFLEKQIRGTLLLTALTATTAAKSVLVTDKPIRYYSEPRN